MKKFHYTYRISNIKTNTHYYGSRSSTIHPKDDLGIFYFSSSSNNNFIVEQLDNPENFKYKVINIYNDRKSAISLEIKLHDKFDVGRNISFYNKVKQTSTGFDSTGSKNRKGTKDTKWIHNTDTRENRMIKSSDEIPFGWTDGRNMTKMFWINNSIIETMIFIGTQIPNFWKSGRVKRRVYHNPLTKELIRLKHSDIIPDGFILGNLKGRLMYVYNPETYKELRINPSQNIPDGFIKGRVPVNWIHNTITKESKPLRIDVRIPIGWEFGRLGGWKNKPRQ